MTWKRPIAIALMTLSPQVSLAFCGTYVGTQDSETSNEASRIVVARDGDDIVLTMANDYQGDLAEFGLLIPVPPTVTLNGVSVVSEDALNELDLYTGPRLVTYTEEEVREGVTQTNTRWVDGEQSEGVSSGCGGSGSSRGGSGGYQTTTTSTSTETSTELGDQSFDDVVVEDMATKGGYQLALLSAENGASLAQWASGHGLTIDPATADVLDDYIDGGASFVAAQVTLDALQNGVLWLPPLQVRYQSPVVSLPIRLGTTSSAGVQEMLVFTLNSAFEGWTGISNYGEAPIQSECLYSGDDFSAFYQDRYREALAPEVTGVSDDTYDTAGPVEDLSATWLVEYGWGSGKCDPCTDEDQLGLDEDTVWRLGWTRGINDVFVTRIRMRFAPEEIGQDLVLYSSYVPFNSQLRYIQDAPYLDGVFPTCEQGLRRARQADGVVSASHLAGLGTATGLFMFLGLTVFRRRDL